MMPMTRGRAAPIIRGVLLSGLALLTATVASAAPAEKPFSWGASTSQPANASPAPVQRKGAKPVAAKTAGAEADRAAAAETRAPEDSLASAAKPTAAKPATAETPATPPAPAPKPIAFDKLPKAIKTLHVCADANSKIEIDSERYAKAVVFFVTCPAARGALTPTAVYVAKDTKGTGAKLVKFEAITADGNPLTLDTLYSVTPARQAFTKDGDPQPNTHTNNETPWLAGAWRPDDRPGICAVAAQWRLQGEKGELWLWEEAKECQDRALPKYESKVDKKPPPLVGR